MPLLYPFQMKRFAFSFLFLSYFKSSKPTLSYPFLKCGELPKAFVVKKADAQVTEEEIIHFVEERAAPYKKLKGGVQFINEIPKSSSGKILRRILKEKH